MHTASPRGSCCFHIATAIIILSRVVVLRAFLLGVSSVQRSSSPSSSSAAAVAFAIMPKRFKASSGGSSGSTSISTNTNTNTNTSINNNNGGGDDSISSSAVSSSRRRKHEIVYGAVVPKALTLAAKQAAASGAVTSAVAKETALATTTRRARAVESTTSDAASMSTVSRSAAPKRATTTSASASSSPATAAPSSTSTTTKTPKKKTQSASTSSMSTTTAITTATTATSTTTATRNATSTSSKKIKTIPLPVPPAIAAAALAAARANAAAVSNTPILLHTLPKLYFATVVHRPSKVCKSPYLCDIQVKGQTSLTMAHTPSLGCSGLVSPGAEVLVSESTSKSSTTKSTHVLHHVVKREDDGTSHWIGTHPMTANILAEALLIGGHVFPNLPPVENVQKEVTMGNSRFDFVVTHSDGSLTVVETKNVPVADNFDGTKKERAALLAACEEAPNAYGKVAIFPDGYRKKVADPVSPRALKHVQELELIAQEGGKRACLLFVSQRTDVASFVVASTDVQYRAAVQKAANNGVVLKAFSVRWDGATGRAYLHTELPIVW